MRRWWIVLIVGLGLAVPPALAQQTSGVLFLFGTSGPGKPVSTTNVPAQLTGTLTVSFHGDPATGCAGQGICGYTGNVVFSPGGGALIGVATFRQKGHVSYQVQLDLTGGAATGGPGGALTAAHVQRAGGGLCGDAVHPQVGLRATITHGVIALPFLQPGGVLLSTRCAGPLDSDLAGLGPQLSLPVRQLLKGRRALDLGGSWSFASGGFTGSVTSTLRLALGGPSTQSASAGPRFRIGRHEREVTETLTVAHAQGELNMAVGSDASTCQFVDSCGIQGTGSAMIDPQAPTGYLTVIGPASRPYDDFLAALGLSRRGNPHGLGVIGNIAWLAGGTAVSSLNGCTSQAPLEGGYVELTESGGRIRGEYTLPYAPRTRCPGPLLAPEQTLASGAARLSHRGVSLTMSGSGNLDDDGYLVSQRTHLSLTLGRGRIRQQTFLEPGP